MAEIDEGRLKRLRNLPQYKDKSDEDIIDSIKGRPFIKKVEDEIKLLSQDYDLSSMKKNDMDLLNMMARAKVRLEDEESILQRAIADGVMASTEARDFEQRLSTMRRDVMSLQKALGITRAERKSASEEDPRLFIASLNERAKHFLEQKLAYIYCPDCHMLAATMWFLKWELPNKIKITCPREECGKEFIVESRDLIENKGRNIEDVPIK
jgi:thiol-disulfide isomerase/thioredoxin